jgi:hypothetical protein
MVVGVGVQRCCCGVNQVQSTADVGVALSSSATDRGLWRGFDVQGTA